MILAWLGAFLVGQAIEVPVYALALRRRRPRLASRLLLAFAPTALTHPIVWFVFPRLFTDDRYWTMVLLAELFAVAVEAIVVRLAGLEWRLAVAASLAANGASVALGLAGRQLFGWP